MKIDSKDSLNSIKTLKINNEEYRYFDINEAAKAAGFDLDDLPYSMKVLFENTLRMENGTDNDQKNLASYKTWLQKSKSSDEISLKPARVLMQDFTGVPAVVDLATMRDAKKNAGGDPISVNPQIPVDLVIDHSIQVDKFGSNNSHKENVKIEMERNKERYQFLKWGQRAFDNFKVVPPGAGICHQVNIENLAHVIFKDGDYLYPDIVVGTDSHTTMVNALSVLGWGVGGIEAESAMLGRTIPMILPEVIGVKITGKMSEGLTATDVVLDITNKLRTYGVVSKFVEFYGEGIKNLSLADRATIANMAPEYGATCGFFPIDEETIAYLRLTARSEEKIAIIEQYAKKQRLWFDVNIQPKYTDVIEVDLDQIQPALAGPKRPQDKILLRDAKDSFMDFAKEVDSGNSDGIVNNGDVVIAAITSCTNTSNPNVLIAAGLVAKKARMLGMEAKPHVKASLAPGSKVVTEYLEQSGLQQYLDELGFNLVGYGCTTCIGNSGPLAPEIEQSIKDDRLLVASVLSGNRNFEGRIHPLTKANYLASPPLVVAYALAGSMKIDINKDPIANVNGKDIYLKDIWPSNDEITQIVQKVVSREMFEEKYRDIFDGDDEWKSLHVDLGDTYSWDDANTYIKKPPYFTRDAGKVGNIEDASILALFGDSVTTDHISPAGNIAKDSPAGKYLLEQNISEKDFNSYGARRGNHEVMMRGTFANVRIRNELCPGTEGGVTMYHPENKRMFIYDAAMLYQASNTPLVVIAGKEYGTGSSRDWAAKGTTLLGVRAVIADSFERIHRSNLIGMGVLPMIFADNVTKASLNLSGSERVTILDLENITKRKKVRAKVGDMEINLELQIFTESEIEYIKNRGILQTVLKHI